MAAVSPRSLQARLLILVFLAFLPAVGIFWFANRELRDLQLEAKQQDLVQRAEVAASEYRTLLDQSQTLLGILAETPDVRSVSLPACTEPLERVLRHTDEYTTISVIGLDGYLACGSLTPEDELYLGDRAYFVRAMSTNQFSVGEFTLGRITGQPVVGLALPIMDNGVPKAVVAASLDLGALGHWRGANPLPEGYTFSVLDRHQQVLVRLPRGGNFTRSDSVGSFAEAGFPSLPEGRDPVVLPGTDLDGIQRLFAVAPLRGTVGTTEGYLAVGRPSATLMQEVDQVVGIQLRILALGGLVLLALAWALGHFWLMRPSFQAEGL